MTCFLFLFLMAYPTTIPSSPTGYDFGDGIFVKPAFEYGAFEYGFLSAGGNGLGDGKLHAFKSTDAGLTWTEKDSTNAPTLSVIAGGGPKYTVARDGSTVLVFIIRVHNVAGDIQVQDIKFYKYDLTTDLWSSPTTFTSPLPDFIYTGNTVGSFVHPSAIFAYLVVRAAGNYIFYYSGAPDVSGGLNYGRVWYATFDGTVFGTPVKIPNQTGAFTYAGLGGVSDTASITHFFYATRDGSADSVIWHVGLDSGFSFGISQKLPLAFSYWEGSNVTVEAATISDPITYTTSGSIETIAIAAEVWSDNFGFQQVIFYYAVAVLNPTWLRSMITGGVDDTSGGAPRHSDIAIFPVPQSFNLREHSISIAASNNGLLAIWVVTDNSFLGSYYYAFSPGQDTVSWTTPVKLFDAGPIVGGSGDTPACAVWTYPMTIGFGVFGETTDDSSFGETMQFDVVAFTGSGGVAIGNIYRQYGMP